MLSDGSDNTKSRIIIAGRMQNAELRRKQFAKEVFDAGLSITSRNADYRQIRHFSQNPCRVINIVSVNCLLYRMIDKIH